MEHAHKKEGIETLPVVDFVYDRDMDVRCLFRNGPGGQFSPQPTQTYKKFVEQFGSQPTSESASEFIGNYFVENKIDVSARIEEYKTESQEIMSNFQKTAEKVFGIKIPEGTKAYLTISTRCPYNIEENWFYATIASPDRVISISMHELWHFYTWYKFGKKQYETGEVDNQKYGDIKEALTVLLNSECLNLLPQGERDHGYPQHKQLRERIVELWKQNPDIEFVWSAIWAELQQAFV